MTSFGKYKAVMFLAFVSPSFSSGSSDQLHVKPLFVVLEQKVEQVMTSSLRMDLGELLHHLDGYLAALNPSSLRQFHHARSLVSLSADVETLRQIKAVSNDLSHEADRLIKTGLNRVPAGQQKDSRVEVEGEKHESGSKRDRDASSPNGPETCSPTESKEAGNPAALDKTRTKEKSKKPKLELPQDSSRGHLTPGTVNTEKKSGLSSDHVYRLSTTAIMTKVTKSKPGPGNHSETKGESQTSTKQEVKAEAAGEPSRKLSKGELKKGTAQLAKPKHKDSTPEQQPSIEEASD